MAASEANVDDPGMLAEVVSSLERAGTAKTARKAAKKEAKRFRRAAKRERRATKAAAKQAAKATRKAIEEGTEAPGVTVVAKAKEPRITASKVRNAITLGKAVAPTLLPVVVPYLVRAANAGREAYERYQARRLGISVDDLAEYRGRGAALHARIAGITEGLRELRASGDQEKVAFADQTEATLHQLSAAVRAAERMPSARRKYAHRAVADELDGLEARLLRHLGV
ncbi:DUF6474 family protein [Thermocrispum agreste]|jgi:hypothetical protein